MAKSMAAIALRAFLPKDWEMCLGSLLELVKIA